MPVLSFIEPCLPSLADRLPSGPDWVHEDQVRHPIHLIESTNDARIKTIPKMTGLMPRDRPSLPPQLPLLTIQHAARPVTFRSNLCR
jgi:hypothetical protein